MAWNEPKDDNKSPEDEKKPKDPWQRPDNEDGPPDLDEVWNDVKDKLSGFLGGSKPKRQHPLTSRDGGGNNGDNHSPRHQRPSASNFGGKGLLLLLIVPILLWLASGFYTVEEGKQGVVLQFGRYVNTTNPGLRYHLPTPIQSVQIVDTQGIRFKEIGYRGGGSSNQKSVKDESLMLTADENIVDVKLSVQYQIADPKAYLFQVESPDHTLFNVVESITREVVGDSTMDFVLTEGRSEIVSEIQSKSQRILDEVYQTGLRINDVNLQDAQPPEDVQAAFDDAIRAREDEQRSKNQAQAYRNDILPKARGDAAAILEQAEGYKASAIASAEGEAARFISLLEEYSAAPEVTRQRLYLETMESVLGQSKKILMPEQGNNLMMLPLQDMLGNSRRQSQAGTNVEQPSAGATTATDTLETLNNQPPNNSGITSNDGRNRTRY